MALYNVDISSRISWSTEVEAESEEKAKELAMYEFQDCDVSEMEFWDTHVAYVWTD